MSAYTLYIRQSTTAYIATIMLLLLYIRLGHYKFVSYSITVGVQLVLREYHFTTQPTFTEDDIFNLLPIIWMAQFKVNHYIIEYCPPLLLYCILVHIVIITTI